MTLPELETKRLWLRPLGEQHTDELHRLLVEPKVRRHLLDDEVIDRERAAQWVAESLADERARGYGQWVLSLLGSDRVIGFCGLKSFEEEGVPELLYGLHPDHWGRGLATEASRAALVFGFATRGLERVVATVDPPNLASIRVLERLGMRLGTRDVLHGVKILRYELRCDDFERR